MATGTDSVREEDETTNTAPPAPPAPWDTVDLPEVPSDLSPYDQRKVAESAEDTEMRRQAFAAQAGTSTIDHTMRTRPRVVQPLDENVIYSFQISPSLNPERVYALAPDEHDQVRGYLTDATSFLSSVYATLGKIDSAYRDLMLDKTNTPEMRSSKLHDATSAAYTKAYTGHATAIEALNKKIAFTEGELSKPLEQQAATPRSTELRAVVRGMKSAERNELIRAAIHAETPSAAQRELLQCVLGSHHLTCGLSEIEQTLHVKTYNTRTQPELSRRLDLMRKSLDMLVSIKPATIVDQFEKSMRSKFVRATAISGLASRAAKSLAAINGG